MGIKTAAEILTKTPTEIVLRDVDFTEGDDLGTGETITGMPAFTIVPGGGDPHLEKESHVFSGGKVQLKLRKGVVNTRYTIDLTVTTSAGQTLQACVRLDVSDC